VYSGKAGERSVRSPSFESDEVLLVQNRPDYDVPCGYVVTLAGMDALLSVETCECVDLLVVDGAFQCRACGTVYGLVHGFSVIRAKARRRGRLS
jgi:hypothetical protein